MDNWIMDNWIMDNWITDNGIMDNSAILVTFSTLTDLTESKRFI